MKAIGVIRTSRRERLSKDEFEELLRSAGYDVPTILKQNRGEHPRYNIGPGKLKELKALVEELKPDKIIFANRLTPSQAYNLWKGLNVEVMDRWQLVLEIFEKRAHSKEAKLQVELASLQYEVPLVKEAIRRIKLGDRAGFKGMGEYQTQQYLKHIRYRMGKIRKELDRVRADREVKRKRREELGFILIALAGYTNAGKSTLLNTLSGEDVEARQQMFTTLDTTTRRFQLGGKRVLVTDTVGFIDNLPPFIVEAFHSTLEEIVKADILLLVLDASEAWSEIRRKLLASLRVLRELKTLDKPMVVALNKIDVVSSGHSFEVKRLTEELLEERVPGARVVWISAKKKTLDELYRVLEEIIPGLPKYRPFRIRISPGGNVPKVLSVLSEIGEVLKVSYGEETVVEALIQVGMIKELTGLGVKIEHLNEASKAEESENNE
ncbi:GTPase HflX [Thermococcus sp. Bubb.Bath]|uniref:GTPase HflX n=1 Tax=Thermococcus sp. Bubb.Bath TaxID=1638242 RepID=UPI0014389F94|nr:GTPase HflX [Thermococcus sp. Bubb.Bath]NJF25743.1 GTPase HflX [Thermococcus sp. Bubb.Bath]